MIFNMSGGGGAALNFKVMGGTAEPSNPAENTIWIDTDAKITGWLFSSHQPENPAEGMVWIATGSASNAEFNALKKNGIMVYPMSAKQYVNNELVNKTAKSYQNGKWVNWWTGELYTPGDEWEYITGGWIGVQDGYDGTPYIAPTIAKTETHMSITVPCNNEGTRNTGTLQTKNKINLSGLSKIEFDISGGGNKSYFHLIAYESSPSNPAAVYELPQSVISRKEYALDVSALNGEYYIGISGSNWASTTVYPLNIYNIVTK